MQWIKCSERMPEEGIKLLLYDQQDNMSIGQLDKVNGDYYWLLDGWKKWDLDTQTHWMPLPDKPKD